MRHRAPTAATPPLRLPQTLLALCIPFTIKDLDNLRPPKHQLTGTSDSCRWHVMSPPRRDRAPKSEPLQCVIGGCWFVNGSTGVLDTDARLKTGISGSSDDPCRGQLRGIRNRAGICLTSTVYVWPLMTCSQCAALLTRPASTSCCPDYVEPQRWESFDLARSMFIEAGVAVHRISMSGDLNEEINGMPTSNQ